jgi:hypothetical protein
MRVPVIAAVKEFGQADANGVVHVGLGLQFQLYYGSFVPPVSNTVAGLYPIDLQGMGLRYML